MARAMNHSCSTVNSLALVNAVLELRKGDMDLY